MNLYEEVENLRQQGKLDEAADFFIENSGYEGDKNLSLQEREEMHKSFHDFLVNLFKEASIYQVLESFNRLKESGQFNDLEGYNKNNLC